MEDALHTEEVKSIIYKVNIKYWNRDHKYGIEVPQTVHQAQQLDNNNGNNIWIDSVER